MLMLLAHGLASIVLVPSCALAAAAIGTGGCGFTSRPWTRRFALQRTVKGLIAQAGRLALYPMDSTRYFEFDWAWSRLRRLRRVRAYLDVSSPRFLPLTCVRRFGVERAWFINPDRADLDTTRQWANALSLSRRCHFSAEPIESAALDGERFDAITSISVFEHRRRTARARERPAPSGTRRVALADIALHGGWLRPVRDYDEYNLARPDSEGRSPSSITTCHRCASACCRFWVSRAR